MQSWNYYFENLEVHGHIQISYRYILSEMETIFQTLISNFADDFLKY